MTYLPRYHLERCNEQNKQSASRRNYWTHYTINSMPLKEFVIKFGEYYRANSLENHCKKLFRSNVGNWNADNGKLDILRDPFDATFSLYPHFLSVSSSFIPTVYRMLDNILGGFDWYVHCTLMWVLKRDQFCTPHIIVIN